MIAMAGGAGRSAQVSVHSQSVVVDALAIFRELVGWDLVPTHVAGVGMASSASIGHIDRVYG